MERKKLLIIHEDDKIREGMHTILSRFNFQITYADDGLHGLYAAKATAPDLIISEVDLAILNGLTMGEMIQKEETIQAIPLIYLHDRLDPECLNKAKDLQAKAFLIKPYLDNSLLYAIKRSLQEDVLQVNMNPETVSYDACRVRRLVHKLRDDVTCGTTTCASPGQQV